jgi:hypothetical protein
VDEEGCYDCHGLKGFVVRAGGGARLLGIDPERFELSLHGVLECRDCHADIASIPHGEVREVSCGQPCHGLGAGGKSVSHEGLYWEYAASVHGRATDRRVGCLLCHPAPEAREDGTRDRLDEARHCASCHDENPRVLAWFSDRHFTALAAGERRAPSCPDCHTSHRVLASSAPESSTHPAHLAQTCAAGALASGDRRGCHGALSPASVSGASMNPLADGAGAGRALTIVFNILYGALVSALFVRAGLGLIRGR